MILVLDNHDSFTWNLVDYLRALGAQVQAAQGDAITVAEAMASGAQGMLLAPGPGRPEDAGIGVDLVRACVRARQPVLGVCLGQQVIAQAFGARIVPAPRPMHGKTSAVTHDGSGVFAGLPSPFAATRYHSLVVEEASLPPALEVAARAEDGTVQSIRHRDLPIRGVQFHPESIASEHGHALLRNWLELIR